MADQPTPKEPKAYPCPCVYCGRFVSWPYPRAGMEWHAECERMALRREFEREQMGYLWPR